ncbi:MAG TPA: aminoglycoside phosphotransferase family protein [Ignavibacteria bacterium]|nr:aminoglycoside phosphotransferase family protein [Ignavibacteria bacterium]
MSKYSDIKKVISKNFPGNKIKSIKEFPEGYNNLAYDVRLDNGDYVIKIIKLKGFETYVLKQNKIKILICKKFKNFPIAKIIKSDYTKRVIDKPYTIAEKLKGKSLQKSYKEINNKEEIFEEIGELYGKMHSIKVESYGELDSNLNLIKTYKSWYCENCKKAKEILVKIEENNLLSNRTLKINKDFFKNNKSFLKKEIGPRLCHGDVSLTNILVKKSIGKYVVSGIIDFEFSRASGITQELFSGLREPDRKYKHKESLVKGYLKYNNLPKDWQQLTCLYKWIGSLDRLTKINGMVWRDLNKEQTKERKKHLRKDALRNLRNMRKRLDLLNKSKNL